MLWSSEALTACSLTEMLFSRGSRRMLPALLLFSFEHIARATKGVPTDQVLRVIADLGKAVGAKGLVAGRVRQHFDMEAPVKSSQNKSHDRLVRPQFWAV